MITPSLSDMISQNASAHSLQRAAIAGGMAPLRDVAVARIRRGETTLQEVERVLGDSIEDAPQAGGPPSVLVVNPDPAWRRMARALLESGGFRVSEAVDHDGASALVKDGIQFAMMVTDMAMPLLASGPSLGLLSSGDGIDVPLQLHTDSGVAGLGNGGDNHGSDAPATDSPRPSLDWARFAATVQTAVRRGEN